MAQLLITNEKGVSFFPLVEEGVEWTTDRRGSPGTLKFTVLKDKALGNIGEFGEGSAVNLLVNGKTVFYGFVFTKQRDKTNGGGVIRCTAYDQIRYLKNKDTRVYENRTASQFIRAAAADFSLRAGDIEDTRYVIPSRVEENTSLLEMIENALDLTLQNTGEMYVLYDDFGKLALKNLSAMYVGEPGAYLVIDRESGENFEYASSIDSNTFNKIKLTFDNEDTGHREVYMVQDGSNINKWGILQYFDTLQKGENGRAKTDALLKLYNKKTRTLKITGAFGDSRVRAGSMVAVKLDLGDRKLCSFMLVETCRQVYREGECRMDLTLRGGEFTG